MLLIDCDKIASTTLFFSFAMMKTCCFYAIFNNQRVSFKMSEMRGKKICGMEKFQRKQFFQFSVFSGESGWNMDVNVEMPDVETNTSSSDLVASLS